MRYTALATVFALATSAFAKFTCENPEVISETTAGANKDVSVKFMHCSNEDQLRASHDTLRFARQTTPINVCNNPCTIGCFPGEVGTGPNPYDCQVISNAILYDSQNIGDVFTADPSNNTALLVMQYKTCLTFFVDQSGLPLQYCRSDFGPLVDYLAFNCQAQQNAHGGNCIAVDQRWFVQVEHA